MTNHWIDIKNSDCVLIMGSNPAENHPVAFKWVEAAREAGAKIIHVDPRFTRTSARADLYAPLRSGTDIAFLGGMINQIMATKGYFQPYVAHYTNAAFILDPAFDFNDGLFSGYDPAKRAYQKESWQFLKDSQGLPQRDLSLEHPDCVFQQLKKHFSRYNLEKVSAITGTPKEKLKEVYKSFLSTVGQNKAGTIMYAMGWTQHSTGVQNIRAMSIIQLLLGNMGRAGGGVNALRGESNVQGSTDHCLLFHIWPGYLPTPKASMAKLEDYLARTTPTSSDPLSANWWQHRPKYVVSLLKALFGDAAQPENDFGYNWLPKLEDGLTYSWLDIFEKMYNGQIKGLFAWGQNPACSGTNANKTRRALGNLDWLIGVNIFPNETTSFWQGPNQEPEKIKTEVFLLPAAASMEKEGSITNSGRWMQWRYKAVEPPGQAKPDGQIMVELFRKIRDLYQDFSGPAPEAILNLRPELFENGFKADQVAKLINGRFERDVEIKGKRFKAGQQVPSFAWLKEDGSTSSGNWLYCASFTEKGNMAARRDKTDPTGLGLFPKWSWCWPVNRRILYNRASVDLQGQPWDESKPVITWTGAGWQGDVPDGGWPPLSQGAKSRRPFIMKPEGVASIFGPGLKDGPFPEHYEPFESPLAANPMSTQRINPVAPLFTGPADKLARDDPAFPLVGTTYRVTDHWQSGVMSRWQPWLLETQPRLFVELSRELAREKNIANGQLCRVASARGRVVAVAVVTGRLKPMTIEGRTVHQIGLPWCFGWLQPRNGGDSANLLTPTVGDPNTRIPETKAFMCSLDRIEEEAR